MNEENLFDYRSHEAKVKDAWDRFFKIKNKSPLVAHDAPITSRLAAEKLRNTPRYKGQLEICLAIVCESRDSGVTDDEINTMVRDLGLRWGTSSVSSRMSWLRTNRLVRTGPETRRTGCNERALINRVW